MKKSVYILVTTGFALLNAACALLQIGLLTQMYFRKKDPAQPLPVQERLADAQAKRASLLGSIAALRARRADK